MLTMAMNNDKPQGCTEATGFGPFHVEGAPHYELGDDIANGAKGTPCLVRGTVKGINGETIPGAEMDVWQSDDDGLYDVQHEGLDHAQSRSEEHTSELQSLMRISYAVFCLKKKTQNLNLRAQ